MLFTEGVGAGKLPSLLIVPDGIFKLVDPKLESLFSSLRLGSYVFVGVAVGLEEASGEAVLVVCVVLVLEVLLVHPVSKSAGTINATGSKTFLIMNISAFNLKEHSQVYTGCIMSVSHGIMILSDKPDGRLNQ